MFRHYPYAAADLLRVLGQTFESTVMRSTIEHIFEAIEANAGYAVVALTTSFALTGCLHLLWG